MIDELIISVHADNVQSTTRLNNWPHTIRSIACFHVIKTFYLVVVGSFPDVKFRSILSVFDISIDLIYFTLNLYYLYQVYVQPGT